MNFKLRKNNSLKEGCAKCGSINYSSLTWYNNNNYGDCCLETVRLENQMKSHSLERETENHFVLGNSAGLFY